MDKPQTLYLNAVIHTMDYRNPLVEAMLVGDARILAIGSNEELEAVAKPGSKRVNLAGQTVIPGFNDCHCHILALGLNLAHVDVSADSVRNIIGICEAVRRRAQSSRPGAWVLGRGYDQNGLEDGRHPNRHDLDDVTPNHPAVLWHTSMHALVANSIALAVANISSETANPPGGEIDHDEHGEPTGLLRETAMKFMGAAIPPPDVDQGAEAIRKAMQLMASFGITSATDAATGEGSSVDPELAMYRRAIAENPSVRISLLPEIKYVAPSDTQEILPPTAFDVGDQPELLRIAGTKLFSDGALSTRTAAMRTPYADDSNNRGMLLWDDDVLADTIRRVHTAGWNIATHALGDRAVELVLDCYRAATAAAPDQQSRHRIEHCMVLDEALCRQMPALGVVPVIQPDIYRLGDGYISALGSERAADVIPMNLIARVGLRAALSSDAPVVPCDPLANIRSAIERKTPSGATLGLHHAISAMQAIRLYTVGGAYATRTERERGKIRPGMLADFTVLSRDPATTPIDEWESIHVSMTVVGGEVSYRL